jgi:hypothetical protein
MKLLRSAFVPLLFCTFASVAWAQPAPLPPPLPPPPPQVDASPPPLPPVASDPELEPQVTIIRRESETVEEVRIGGELKFVKVTPTTGRPYYLVPNRGGTGFLRRNSLDISLSVPLWVLFSW